MKKKDGFLRGFNNILRLTNLGSAIIVCVVFNTIFMLYKVCTKGIEFEGMLDLFDGMASGFTVMMFMVSLIIPASIAMMYNLLVMFPIKSEHIPKSMMLIIDTIFIGCFIVEAPMFLLCGFYKEMCIEFIGILVMYSATCLGDAAFTQPGMAAAKWEFKVRYIFIYLGMFSLLIISLIIRIAAFSIADNFSVGVILIAVGVILAAAVFTRIFSAKRLYAKVRMTKVFRSSKSMKNKEESYV